MKKNTQTQLAAKVGISQSHFNNILFGKRRPSWKKAKILAAITNTTPELWLDGSPEEIRAKIQVSA